MPDEEMSRLPSIRKKAYDLIKDVLFEYYGVRRGNISEEIELLLINGIKYSHLEKAYNRVMENKGKLIQPTGVSPHSIRGHGSGDHPKCQLENKVLKAIDNSKIYMQDRTFKEEIKEVISIVIDKPVSQRQWNKYSKLLRDTGRISWKNGTNRYYVHREKMGYATRKTKRNYEKLNKGVQLKFKTNFIRTKAMAIYDQYKVGDVVHVDDISKSHQIHGRSRELVLNAMRYNKMITMFNRETVIFLDYKQEARADLKVGD